MPEVFNTEFKSLLIKNKNIFNVTIISLIYLFSWALVSPYITIRIHHVSGDFLITGLLIAVYYLVRLFFDIPISRFCEKRNTKKVLEFFFILAALVSLCYVVASTNLQLLSLRLLHGFVAAGLWISFWTYTREVRTKKKLKEQPAELLLTDYLSDFVLFMGPFLGGLLIASYNWQLGFVLVSLGMVFGLFFTMRKITPIKSPVKTLKPFKEEFRNFTIFKKVSTLPLLVVLFFGMGSIFWVFLPILLYRAGYGLMGIGISLALMYVSSLLMQENVRYHTKKYGCKVSILVSILLQAVSFWLLSKTLILPVVFLASLIVGVAWLYFKQGANYYFQRVLKIETKSVVEGSLRMFLQLGVFLVLPVFGFALNIMDMHRVFYLLAVANILLITLTWPLIAHKTNKTKTSKSF